MLRPAIVVGECCVVSLHFVLYQPTGKKAFTKYGVGDVVIKRGDGDKKAQLLMYNDTTGKLFINTYLTPKTETNVTNKGVVFPIYYPDEGDGKGAWLSTMLRVRYWSVLRSLFILVTSVVCSAKPMT